MSEPNGRPASRGHAMLRKLAWLNLRSTEHDDANARAELARLRRCAGLTVAEAASGRPEGLMTFYRLVPDAPPAEEADLFLIATLYALAAPPLRSTDRDPTEYADMGAHLAALARATAEGNAEDRFKAVGRRLGILLDCTREDLPFRLRQTARLLAGHQVTIQWRPLLWAVQRWADPARTVQRRWARSFYQAAPGTALINDASFSETQEDTDVD